MLIYRTLLVLALTSVAAQAKPLLSPWDGHAVTATATPYACPALPHITPDLTTDGFYRLDDPTHSIIDPVRMAAYTASAKPVKDEGLAIIHAADAFRTTGSREAAHCAFRHVLTLAQDKSLTGKMSSGQAYYVQGWVVGAIAIAYLKVRDAEAVTPPQAALIGQWMHSVGEQTRNYYDAHARKEPKGNNHLYWAGIQLAATGVAANNQSDFEWGMATYDNGVNQIRPDGVLPQEMERGARALHYHLYALAPLVLLAEFGEVNGRDLYAHNHGAIHKLADISVAGFADPTLFAKGTGVKQEVEAASGDQIGWAPPYARRFPDPVLSKLIASAPTLSVFYLGGLPPQ